MSRIRKIVIIALISIFCSNKASIESNGAYIASSLYFLNSSARSIELVALYSIATMYYWYNTYNAYFKPSEDSVFLEGRRKILEQTKINHEQNEQEEFKSQDSNITDKLANIRGISKEIKNINDEINSVQNEIALEKKNFNHLWECKLALQSVLGVAGTGLCIFGITSFFLNPKKSSLLSCL